MNDIEALKKLRNMDETDLLNLLHSREALDKANSDLANELEKAREILVDLCNATGTAQCTPDVSLEFLAHLPEEVRLGMVNLRKDVLVQREAANAMFSVIAEIAGLLFIDDSELELSRKTIAAVKEQGERLAATLYELDKEQLFIALDKAKPGKEADELLEQTMNYDEHPAWYTEECACQLCCSYGDQV